MAVDSRAQASESSFENYAVRGPLFRGRFLGKFNLVQLGRACLVRNMDPSLGSANCVGSENDKTVVSEFEDCRLRRLSISAQGRMDFDSPETCNAWIDGAETSS